MAPDTMLKYAEMGAQMRLTELDTERDRILALFPSLNGGSPNWPDPPFRAKAKAKATTATVTIPTSVTITGKRKGRKMPEAQRKAVGRRMKKFWAAKRRAKKQGFVVPSAK
jgi:hypothetical protein